MEKRKAAIIEAHIARCNAMCDAHLHTTKQEVPKIFRNGMFCETEIAEKLADEKVAMDEEAKLRIEEPPVEDPDQPADDENKPNEVEAADEQQIGKNSSDTDFQVAKI